MTREQMRVLEKMFPKGFIVVHISDSDDEEFGCVLFNPSDNDLLDNIEQSIMESTEEMEDHNIEGDDDLEDVNDEQEQSKDTSVPDYMPDDWR